mmetsp:Transcript_14189/g.30977  ORF Transcript_14189/g.30977 Transcript_14189/m.30977 type:complete len:214 (+) Transcript_14189:172-813(+)
MGRDWYYFKAICNSGYAVMVTNKDVKEVHSPGSSDTDGVGFTDPLNEDEVKWLLDQAKGFRMYQLADSFVLIMKDNDKILEPPTLHVAGPYEIEDQFARCTVEEAPKGAEYNGLLEIARKLTPEGSKLSFPPGRYCFSMTSSYLVTVKELQATKDETKVSAAQGRKEEAETHQPSELKRGVPSDFELVVGTGEKQKTFATIKASSPFLCLPWI